MKHISFLFFIIAFKILNAQDTVKVNVNSTPDQIAETDYNNGLLAIKNKDLPGALVLFSKSIAAKPDFDKAFSNRAIAYSGLKQFDAALSDINRALGLNPKNPESYFNKALIFFSMQKRDSESLALDNCLMLNPAHAEACYYKALLFYEKNDLKKALELYSKAIESRPDYSYAFNDRGSVKRALGDYAGAIADYGQALSTTTDNRVFIYNNLGSAYRLNKEQAKAIEAYNKAIEADPSYLTALNNRGAAYFENSDLKAAQRDFEEVLKKDPKNASAYNNLASIAIKEKDYKKAKEMSSRSIALDPQNGPAYYNRGIAGQMLREEGSSCSDWKKALELGVESARVFVNMSCMN